MAKSIIPKPTLTKKIKQKEDSKKYTCGCGKKYSSYPAYSTHRKSKHNNLHLEGTFIPKPENPKRGRPSYEFVRRNHAKLSQS